MMKKTLCLLFVLAFIAQIAAIPTDKAEAEAQAAAENAAAEAKKKAGAATNEVEHKADAKAAGEHKADAAEAVAHATDKLKKAAHSQEHPHSIPHHPGKDCHKPQNKPLTAAVDKADDFEKKLADAGAKLAKDFLGIFGL